MVETCPQDQGVVVGMCHCAPMFPSSLSSSVADAAVARISTGLLGIEMSSPQNNNELVAQTYIVSESSHFPI
jgi:hypothetical protein